MSGDRTLIRFGTGDEVTVQAGPRGLRFLLISGAPIDEPVAWHGPIVMNTQDELHKAMRDLRNGTFIKAGPLKNGVGQLPAPTSASCAPYPSIS